MDPPALGLEHPPRRPTGKEIDGIFEAIASPVRRSILDALRDGGCRTAAELAEQLDGPSRATVARHLRVLRDVELVRALQVGRSWQYTVATEPLDSIYRSWLAGFVSSSRQGRSQESPCVERAASEHAVAQEFRSDEVPSAGDGPANDIPLPADGAVGPDVVERAVEPADVPRSAEDLVMRISRRLDSMPRETARHRADRTVFAPLADPVGEGVEDRRPFARLRPERR